MAEKQIPQFEYGKEMVPGLEVIVGDEGVMKFAGVIEYPQIKNYSIPVFLLEIKEDDKIKYKMVEALSESKFNKDIITFDRGDYYNKIKQIWESLN